MTATLIRLLLKSFPPHRHMLKEQICLFRKGARQATPWTFLGSLSAMKHMMNMCSSVNFYKTRVRFLINKMFGCSFWVLFIHRANITGTSSQLWLHLRPLKWIWKSKCVPKVKNFTWLPLNDRLNTRNILRRRYKHLDEGYNCALCQDDLEETMLHLFFWKCTTSVSCWFSIGLCVRLNLEINSCVSHVCGCCYLLLLVICVSTYSKFFLGFGPDLSLDEVSRQKKGNKYLRKCSNSII